jgi:hypothetical protein
MNNKKQLMIVSLFGNINNINSRVYKIDNAFQWDTIFVTPNFDHSKKENKVLLQANSSRIKTIYLNVPPYSKNLSFKRIYSHLVFAYKLRLYLKSLKDKDRPEILISLMPTSTAAWVAGRFCKKNKIYFVVDVIDLWPESLLPLSKNNVIVKTLVKPWAIITKKVYKLANFISAESKAYSKIASACNTTVKASYTYLGVNSSQISKIISTSLGNSLQKNNELVFCYGGSLNNSYDFDSLLCAIKFIHDKKVKYKMFFVGEGEKRDDILSYSKINNLNVEITGRLPYEEYLKYLSTCDIAFNSFKKNTKVVHSYKFNDYCATGLFIFNSLKGETEELIEKYDIGINYSNENLSEKLLYVVQNWDLFKKKRNNLKNIIKNELESDKIYRRLSKDIITEINNFQIK